jgi:hypothetical protein
MAYVPKKAKKGYDIEKDIESLGKRHKKAAAKLQGKKKPEEDWVDRLKRNVKMLLKGKHYKVPKKK